MNRSSIRKIKRSFFLLILFNFIQLIRFFEIITIIHSNIDWINIDSLIIKMKLQKTDVQGLFYVWSVSPQWKHEFGRIE